MPQCHCFHCDNDLGLCPDFNFPVAGELTQINQAIARKFTEDFDISECDCLSFGTGLLHDQSINGFQLLGPQEGNTILSQMVQLKDGRYKVSVDNNPDCFFQLLSAAINHMFAFYGRHDLEL